MTLKNLLTHWPILTLVFASGTAFAWQEVQRQTLEQVVITQSAQTTEQKRVNEAVIRLEANQRFSDERERDMQSKLDMLIKLQMERRQ